MIKFGLKNFRVFKEEQKFDFRPITLLIGPNNSGKSSVMKSLLLLRENITGDDLPLKLKFDSRKLSMNSLEDIVSGSEYMTISYMFDTYTMYLGNIQWVLHYTEHVYYQEFVELNTVEIKNDHGTIIEFEFDKHNFYNVHVDLRFLIGSFLDVLQSLIKMSNEFDLNDVMTYEVRKNEKNRQGVSFSLNQNYEKVLVTKEYSLWKVFFHLYDLDPAEKYNVEKIASNHGGYLFKVNILDIDSYEREIVDKFSLRIKEKYAETEIKRRVWRKSQMNMYLNKKDSLSELIGEFFEFIERESKEMLVSELSQQGYSLEDIQLTEFGRFVFDRLSPVLTNMNLNISGQLKKLGNVPVTRVLKNRFFDIKDDESYLAKRIQDYIYCERNLGPNDAFSNYSDELYCDYWIKEFGIGERLVFDPSPHLEPYKKQIVSLYIQGSDGQNINIANMGSGVSQIISVLLSPLEFIRDNDDPNFFDGSEYTVYLEEPESNLHPNWQSKLMDLIVDIHDVFGIRFIIETHSEYMMRKLQYLTASPESQIKPNDSVVYYLGSVGQEQKNNEKRVKRITIDKQGNLSEDFGSGFYDEAINLKFDLLRLNKAQQN